jgi:hypothetical protein
MCVAGGCSGSSAATTTTTTGGGTTTGNTQYVAAYKAATWGSTVTATFPSSCEMTLVTTGKPDYTPNPWYLAPASGGETVVAHSTLTNTAMALISYASMIAPALQGNTITLNICPAKASSTTATGLGAIGYLISGTAMFNPYEMDATTAAVNDNASYTFTDSNGVSQTAYFLDQCDSHSNGNTWHAHGNPNCVTSQADTSTGPSHIIGVALDGYPIYGGRDINGNIVSVSSLDACNGITSPTPEFPSGAYHYVLPIGVTTEYVSINCYVGTVSSQTVAEGRKLACNMKMMFAMLESAQEKNRGKEKKSKPVLAAKPAGTMDMASMNMGSM